MRNNKSIVTALAAVICTMAAPAQDPAPPAPKPAEKPLKADPANDLFELALLSYREGLEEKDGKRKKETFLAAIRQFDRFHKAYPQNPNALKSWYYSAVCYQKIGNMASYRGCLSAVVENWKKGPLVGAAAYQLASEHYKAGQFEKAEPHYKIAAAHTDNEEYKHRAIYSRALCFEKLGKRPQTIAALREVLADKGSPFQERAEVYIAHLYKKDDNKEEAMAHFINLAKSENRDTRADAILQCALLARDLGKKEFSETYFEKILTTPGLEEWRGEAQLSLMSSAAKDKNHQRVVDLFSRGDFKLAKEQQARRLQLAAASYKATGDEKTSFALYEQLAKIAPGGMTGFEAGYVVLSQAYKTGGRDLIRQVEHFLRTYSEKHPEDPRVHNAHLMAAEAYYKANKFAQSADSYNRIDFTHIAAENHAGLRYRLASSRLQAGDRPGALAAFNTFIEKHSGDPRAVNAILKRADAFLEDGRTDDAHKEFDRLMTHSKDPKLKEYALVQKSALYKEANDLEPFAKCHERLIAEFPKRETKKKAASQFWIGWALFRQDKFADCLARFNSAREGDENSLGRESTLHLALANYSLKNRDELKTELDRLLKNYPGENVPRPVFAWLGTSLASEKDYPGAWTYLRHAITPKEPTKTKVVVWRAAGRSALEAEAFEQALRPLEIVLQVEDNPYRKAETHYFLSRAHMGLKDPERARKAAESCLELKPQGLLNAQARLLLGDIAMAQGDPNTAAQHFVPVVEFYSKESETKRSALRKAVAALELKGDEASLKSAERYRAMLEKSPNSPGSAP